MVATKKPFAAAIIAVSLVILVSLVAFIPVPTAGLTSHPRPLTSYSAAMAAASAVQRTDDSIAAPRGRTIVLTHGKATARSVVLLHGFTNSPLQFDSLAAMLYREGDNVYVPRLPDHALRVGGATMLAKVTAEALRDAADGAADIARGLGDSVVVVGLSGGGTMALWLAQFRGDVHRVVIIAPLVAVARVPRIVETPAIGLSIRLPEITHADPRDSLQPDRELGWSTHGVGQILRLGLAARRASNTTPPAVHDVRILLNANDRTISPTPVLTLARRWLRARAFVAAYELPDSLRLPHDVIDPRQRIRRTDVVYPVVQALVRGEIPPRQLVAAIVLATP